MLYAAGFFVPDPFIFFQHKNNRHIVMSDLEIDRAKKQAHADRVLSFSLYQKKLRKLGKSPAAVIDILDLIFRERGIRSLIVPANFSALLLDQLRAKGYSVQIKRDPFWPQRETKNNREVKQITESLRVARLGLEAGIRMLKRTKTKRDGYLYLNGTRLTSEMLKTAVNTTIMAQGWLPSHTIISSGNQCVDPHHEGSGPIKRQYLDHLRYLSALATQRLFRRLEPHRRARARFGKNKRDLCDGASRAADRLRRRSATASTAKKSTRIFSIMFDARGFPTGRINGRMQGFFHGTGHGLGLDIHEAAAHRAG